MKAAELKKLLQDIPDDVELIVGDPDTGLYWNPVMARHPGMTTRRVSEEWAQTQIRRVTFFALFNQHDRAASVCPSRGNVVVRALSQ